MRHLFHAVLSLLVLSVPTGAHARCGGEAVPAAKETTSKNHYIPSLKNATFTDPSKLPPEEQFEIRSSENGWTLSSGRSEIYYSGDKVCLREGHRGTPVCGAELEKIMPIALRPIHADDLKYLSSEAKIATTVGIVQIHNGAIHILSTDSRGHADPNKPALKIEQAKLSDRAKSRYTWKITSKSDASTIAGETILDREVEGESGAYKESGIQQATAKDRCPKFLPPTKLELSGQFNHRDVRGEIESQKYQRPSGRQFATVRATNE